MFKLIVAVVISMVSLAAQAKSIMVLGDSISAAYGIDVGQGWVKLVQGKIESGHRNYSIINESITGDTTAGGLARLDNALATHKPNVVILELGANDGLRGLSPVLIKNNLAEIIRRIQQSGAKVLLVSMRIPPNYGKRYTDMFYAVYPQLANELKVPFVPFILEDIALVKQLMQNDGLHPNEKAQPLIADKIWPQLKTLLEKQ